MTLFINNHLQAYLYLYFCLVCPGRSGQRHDNKADEMPQKRMKKTESFCYLNIKKDLWAIDRFKVNIYIVTQALVLDAKTAQIFLA